MDCIGKEDSIIDEHTLHFRNDLQVQRLQICNDN